MRRLRDRAPTRPTLCIIKHWIDVKAEEVEVLPKRAAEIAVRQAAHIVEDEPLRIRPANILDLVSLERRRGGREKTMEVPHMARAQKAGF